MWRIILCLLFLCFFYSIGFTDCRKLTYRVKSASEFVLGIDFPWWFNLGQLEAESGCIWRTSVDGWGSIGYAQITPRFWGSVLRRVFPNWDKVGHTDHFLAQAYILKSLLGQIVCEKLWVMYQCYNRSCIKVNREANLAKCDYSKAFDICLENPQFICVWKRFDGSCRQWRSSCDINYSYSWKVYKNGQKYSSGIVIKKYSFF